jgi:Heterokaryon incompatibility protein (HET)
MPIRVINVTRFEKDVCLRNGSDIDEFQEYITLSYCWGTGQILKLSKENLGPFSEHIPFERLPKTFADAVTVTRLLGIYYLRVDSLCIIQDSHTD